MFITKMALPRRTFLRGLGVTLALPLLDAMVPALSAMETTAARPVKRLGFVYIPMGSNIDAWTPKAVGRITELSPTLTSLTPFINSVTVLSKAKYVGPSVVSPDAISVLVPLGLKTRTSSGLVDVVVPTLPAIWRLLFIQWV